MAKNVDHQFDGDVMDIMERMTEKFPKCFGGFDVGLIHVIYTKTKKSKIPIRLIASGYPHYIFTQKPYIVEVFEEMWNEMDPKRRNLAVFHAMCGVPDDGFDDQSNHYGKKVQPDVKMYLQEFAISGGIPNWMENDAAKDPMGEDGDDSEPAIPEPKEDEVVRSPVTAEGVMAGADAAAG